jgi:hypothetical protein
MKNSKIKMLLAFVLNLMFLLFSLSGIRTGIPILNEFGNKEQVILILIAPILQIVATIAAFIFWLKFRKKEKEGQMIKYSNIIGTIFVILAPILFFVSMWVNFYFINLAISAHLYD